MSARVRPLETGDRDAVAKILARASNFTVDEIATALELVDEWLSDGPASGYLTDVVVDSEDVVRGYVCFGEAPLTVGTYDLYWIAVESAAQGAGYGQRLLRFAEDEVRRLDGRLLLIETSSLETYAATQRFYERAGYELIARLPEYYKPGDDKLVFAKRI